MIQLAPQDVALPAALRLRELPGMAGETWDALIAGYAQATVFHSSGWHRVLEASHPGRVLRFEIECDGRVCGHWCGVLVEKFGARVFGAPLPGTATDYMFPLFSAAPSSRVFLAAVRTWAASARIGVVELGGEYFDFASLDAERFHRREARTYRVDLTAGEDAVWRRLKPAMRNKVRKAEKQGVVIVEGASDGFASVFFDMLRDVFNRQGMAPTYDRQRIDTVVRLLRETGQLAGLLARRGDEVMAGVILLLDRHAAYYWAGASFTTAYPYGANDLIQWRALQLAMSRGRMTYDACGGGDYKEKFNGRFVSLPAGYFTSNPMFGLVRAGVSHGFRARQAVLGAVQRVTRSRR